ncbi:hypothetical protein ACFUAG_16280 [Streptomyces sp. NPDC057193]|uniref:hypothetical protein n=1 Tax=Streptomyces sp. NPDC057193 TaxID=3346043 RepID=UPI003636AC5D
MFVLRSKVQRVLVAACVAGAAAILPVMTAAPAQASIIDCQTYLHYKGYKVGPKVTHACGFGVDWQWGICMTYLTNAGVRSEHAQVACNLA